MTRLYVHLINQQFTRWIRFISFYLLFVGADLWRSKDEAVELLWTEMLTNGRRGIHLALLGLFHHLTPQLIAASDLCDAITLVKRETAALLVGQVPLCVLC